MHGAAQFYGLVLAQELTDQPLQLLLVSFTRSDIRKA
jgi:hypothetical protein